MYLVAGHGVPRFGCRGAAPMANDLDATPMAKAVDLKSYDGLK